MPSLNSKLEIINSRSAGFTLIELLIVITILGILAGAISINLVGYYRNQQLDLAAQQTVASIREAQNKAVTQQGGQQWGIYFRNEASADDFYAVFAGSSYQTSATTSPVYFSSPIGFSTPASGASSTVTFAQLTGLPNASTTVIITNGTRTKTILINAQGQVEY